MNELNASHKKGMPIIAGIAMALSCLIITAVIVFILLVINGIEEDDISVYAYFIHGLSIFIGGFISGKKAGVKGWYYGGMLGICYSILIMITAFLGFDIGPSLRSLGLLAISFVMGALGGMLGVHARR